MRRVTVSLDFECGWGAIENGLWRKRESDGIYSRMRDDIPDFLDLLAERDLCFTWAAVGAMCEDTNAIKIDHLKGRYRQLTEDFLEHAAKETCDGRDILNAVKSCATMQALASHGYTHVRFDDEEQDNAAFVNELSRAKAASRAIGFEPRSFVFPVNKAACIKELSNAGFRRARLAAHPAGSALLHRILGTVSGPIGRAASLYLQPPASSLRSNGPGGLELETGTDLLNWGWNAGALKRHGVKRRVLRALNAAQAGSIDAHFWLHPFNLTETPGLMSFATKFIDQLSRARDLKKIYIEAF